ncbi:MAG: S8 family serine peptidase [Kofleriaceae bacterium]
MDEETPPPAKRSSFGRILWLLVIAAIVILWWHYRGAGEAMDPDPVAQQAMDRLNSPDADPDDILVDLKDDVSVERVAEIERASGIDLVLVSDESADEQFYRAHVDPAKRDSILAQLSALSDVEVAEPDALAYIPQGEEALRVPAPEASYEGFPNDPLYAKQWHMRQIGMPAAWKLANGNGVIVAVLDTGIGYEDKGKFTELPDLKGIKWVKPYNFVANNKSAHDDHGHGSHVTGTIAQVTNNGIGVTGVALNVKIMPLKVLSKNGSGSVGGIADAIRYAADNGAKVINMSLGSSYPSTPLKNAVKYAYDKGVTIVCAAGNESRDKVGYPAAYPGAIAVSATQNDEAITFYSNYGEAIDIAAPGGNTRDKNGGRNNPDGGVLQNTIAIGDPSKNDYYAYMGTSMASPHAAGVAALVVGEGVTKPAAVEKILQLTARKPTNQQYSKEKYGAGIIDAPAAVKAAKKKAGGGGGELALGLLIAGAVAASARSKGLGAGVKLGAGYLVGVVVGASGLFFLPHVSATLAEAPVLEMLSHGMPSWDMSILGAAGHGNAVFFSALIPFVLLAVGYGVPKLRAPLAGLTLGVAAHLVFAAITPAMALSYVPSMFGFAPIWLAVNAIVCVLLARTALRR